MKNSPKHWYALYTRSRHEKKIHFHLQQLGIVAFLPMHIELRKWSDRIKKIEMPLFPNYIFVHCSRHKLWQASSLQGAIKFVGIGSSPSTIPDAVIESLQKVDREEVQIEDLGLLKGEMVKITEGKFMGAEGMFVRKGTKNMLAIGIEIMNRVVLVELKSTHVQKLNCVS